MAWETATEEDEVRTRIYKEIARYKRKFLITDFRIKRKSSSGSLDSRNLRLQCLLTWRQMKVAWWEDRSKPTVERTPLPMIAVLKKSQDTFKKLAFIPRPSTKSRSMVNDRGTSTPNSGRWLCILGILQPKKDVFQEIHPIDLGEMETESTESSSKSQTSSHDIFAKYPSTPTKVRLGSLFSWILERFLSYDLTGAMWRPLRASCFYLAGWRAMQACVMRL